MSNFSTPASLNSPSTLSDSSDIQPRTRQTAPRGATYHFACTDSGNAELMASLYGNILRYNHAMGQWLIWRCHWWAPDSDESVFRFAKETMRQRGREAWEREPFGSEWKWTKTSESRNRLDAMIKLARGERPISDTGEGWDAHPMLLGVQNGVVDLITGKVRNGRQSDHITKHTDVQFEPSAKCPRWEKFVAEVFGNELDLIDWIQKVIGYCLTASTEEQAIFLCYGAGANGKSTFLDVIRYVLGGYAYNLPFSAFELKSRSAIPNEIAPLKGRRFVTAIETNESVELNEGRIKALTGGDPITARLLYKEFFTFEPTGKFFLAFNHKPTVADDSHGFWRRVRLIPFTQQFSGKECDLHLADKLKAEASGILNWAVAGCLKWQAEGLKAPQSVLAASQEYREQSDPLKEFLEDCCQLGPSESVGVSELKDAYKTWAEANGSEPLNPKAFNRRLESRGHQRVRLGHNRTRLWVGIGLTSTSDKEVRTGEDNKTLLLVN